MDVAGACRDSLAKWVTWAAWAGPPTSRYKRITYQQGSKLVFGNLVERGDDTTVRCGGGARVEPPWFICLLTTIPGWGGVAFVRVSCPCCQLLLASTVVALSSTAVGVALAARQS
jgi:hypothetical protein